MILLILFIFNYYIYSQEILDIKNDYNYDPDKSCFICFQDAKTNELKWQNKYLCSYKHKSPAHVDCLKTVNKCPLCRALKKPNAGCLSTIITICERFSRSFQYNNDNQTLTNNFVILQNDSPLDRMYNYNEDTLM